MSTNSDVSLSTQPCYCGVPRLWHCCGVRIYLLNVHIYSTHNASNPHHALDSHVRTSPQSTRSCLTPPTAGQTDDMDPGQPGVPGVEPFEMGSQQGGQAEDLEVPNPDKPHCCRNMYTLVQTLARDR